MSREVSLDIIPKIHYSSIMIVFISMEVFKYILIRLEVLVSKRCQCTREPIYSTIWADKRFMILSSSHLWRMGYSLLQVLQMLTQLAKLKARSIFVLDMQWALCMVIGGQITAKHGH